MLRDVSFRIQAGETIAVVGHTGAGKTTLTNLLLRFYDVQKGTIRIGGVNIRDMDLTELRQTCSIVLQDPYLFSGTVAENNEGRVVSPNGDEFTSNYLKSHYAQFATDRSTLRSFDWLPHAFDHARTRLIIVRTTDRSNRAIAERSGARLVATSARFVAYTMPR